jgi:hypothetical protein
MLGDYVGGWEQEGARKKGEEMIRVSGNRKGQERKCEEMMRVNVSREGREK